MPTIAREMYQKQQELKAIAIKNKIELKNFPYKTEKAYWFETGKTIEFKTNKGNSEVALQMPFLKVEAIDQVIVLQIKK